MDPHALGEWRVNGTLPHIDAWYKAFNITEKDAMFVPKDKRSIFGNILPFHSFFVTLQRINNREGKFELSNMPLLCI